MKTTNDHGHDIYVCPCCTRTWLNPETYVMHLRQMVQTIDKAIKEDLNGTVTR